MTSTKESAHSTIRALLQMTEARGCTRAEAAAARAKAFELMEKYGIGLEDLHPGSQTPTAGGPYQEPDPDERRAYENWSTHGVHSDAFVREVFAQKHGSEAGSRGIGRVARFVAGYVAVGCLIWAFAAFYSAVAPDSQSLRYFEQHAPKTVQPRDLSPEVWAEIDRLSKAHDGLPPLPANRLDRRTEKSFDAQRASSR
jgi:hypothetical protein